MKQILQLRSCRKGNNTTRLQKTEIDQHKLLSSENDQKINWH